MTPGKDPDLFIMPKIRNILKLQTKMMPMQVIPDKRQKKRVQNLEKEAKLFRAINLPGKLKSS